MKFSLRVFKYVDDILSSSEIILFVKSAINANDRKTAAEVFDINYQYAVDNWDSAYAPYSWDD